MNTFLPYPDFERSAACLDRSRLGKQRLEAITLLAAITKGNGWSKHPAAKMWKGFPDALCLYFNAVMHEWERRGYRNEKLKFMSLPAKEVQMPPWLGDERVHSSQRANLLRKNPKWYGQFGWAEQPVEGYFWPV